MRFLKNIVTGLAFLTVTAGGMRLATAQDLSKVPDLDYMPLIFLNKSVAADMHLTANVQQKEMQIFMQEGLSMASSLKGGSAGANVGAQAMTALKKMQDDSLAPLTQAQRERYRQLSLQFFGPTALITPKVAKKLGLSSAQQQRLAASFSSSGKALGSSASSARAGAHSDPMAAMNNLRSATAKARTAQETAAKAILTPAQWSQWQSMQGKKLPGIQDPFGGMMG